MPGWMRNAEPRCVIYILRTGKEGFLFYFFNLVAPFGDSCWHLKKSLGALAGRCSEEEEVRGLKP